MVSQTVFLIDRPALLQAHYWPDSFGKPDVRGRTGRVLDGVVAAQCSLICTIDGYCR